MWRYQHNNHLLALQDARQSFNT